MSSRVQSRNGIGQFAAECSAAAVATAAEMTTDGTKAAKALAPKRSGALANSIYPIYMGKAGRWATGMYYAMFQEEGAGPHQLPGNVSFFWEKMGRQWTPGYNLINHPGNPATRFMRRSYQIVAARAMAIARKHYPG
jgi:hypothetical protein